MTSDAVIFIPGIKGTKLVQTNRVNFDTIWSGIQSNFESIQDLELTGVYQGTRYDEGVANIIEPGELEELAYREFINDLHNGKRPVFIFNYDWRLSARTNGALLSEFVAYIKDKSRAGAEPRPINRFDFITHSLGNFVLRAYLKTDGFAGVNRIVFTVPPFRGSIDIAAAALVGEGWFPNVKAKIRKLIRTFPGALELLTNYDGASAFDTPPHDHDFFEKDHWQKNVTGGTGAAKFIEALAEAKETVDNQLLDLATLKKPQRDRILVIARTGYKTYQSMTAQRRSPGNPDNFFDLRGAVRTKNGDGRVPDVSSCHYHNKVTTLLLHDTFLYRDYSHGFVLKDERTQKLVNRFLFGNDPFDYNIPGGSVKRVTGLELRLKEDRPYWQAAG